MVGHPGGGLGLVLDPPASGSAVGAVAGDLARPLDVVLLLASCEREAFAAAARLPLRLLPERDWASARLEPARVRAAVAALLAPGADVVACEPLTASGRRPERGSPPRLRIRIRVAGTALERSMTIAAEGVGVGRLGAHALAVHGALTPFLPVVLGVRDGLLYREWLPAEGRADRARADDPDEVAARLAGSLDARARVPRTAARTHARRARRAAAWEMAGLLLRARSGPPTPGPRHARRPPGPARAPRRAPGRDRREHELSRSLSGAGGELLGRLGRAVGHELQGPLRSVCDLAQVTARSQDRALARGLRRAYAAAGHDPVDPER